MGRAGKYVGIHKEIHGGMTSIGKIIRDGWVFGVLADTETCEGWDISRFQSLLEKVNEEWDKYGCMVSQLPPELFEKHQRVHNEAIKKARAAGWSGESETDEGK